MTETETEPAYPVHTAIVELLNERGIHFTMHAHLAARTVQEAEDLLSFSAEHMLKTVVFKTRGGDWILAALRGQDTVDYARLAAALETKRSQLLRPTPEEITAELGVEAGGIGPILPTLPAATVLLDSNASDLDVVYCGAGRSDRTLEIRVIDLIYLTGAQIYPIAKDVDEL